MSMYEYRCVLCLKWFVSPVPIYVDDCKICSKCKNLSEPLNV